MARILNVHEAKTHLSRILEDVRAGEEIILAKRGVPIAKLVSVEEPSKRRLGFLNGRLTDVFFEPLPEDEMRHWR